MSEDLSRPDQSTVRGTAFKDCMDAIDGAMAFGCQQSNKPPVGHWLMPYWEIGCKLATEEYVVRRTTTALAEIALIFCPDFEIDGPKPFEKLIKIIRERSMELELYRAQAASNGS